MASKKLSKKPISRGSGFTAAEDEAIEKSWIAASEDPIAGTEQKGSDFFSKIHQVYYDNFKPPNREIRTVPQRRSIQYVYIVSATRHTEKGVPHPKSIVSYAF